MNILVATHLYQAPRQPRTGLFSHKSLRAFAAAGHRVTVVFQAPKLPLPGQPVGLRHTGDPAGLPPAYDLDGVRVLTAPYVPRLSRIAPHLDLWIKFRATMRALKADGRLNQPPDAIMGQMMFPDGPLVERLADHFNRPSVSMLRGDEVHTTPYLNQRMYRRLKRLFKSHDAIFTVSKNLGDQAVALYDAPEVQPQTLYCAADQETFKPGHTINQPPRRLLFIGALVKTKGVYELMAVMKRLAPQFPDLHLTLAGEGPAMGDVSQFLARHGLADQVTLAGFVEHKTLYRLIDESDVLVFPTHMEGLPHAVIEAVLCECAVVAANVGGISEIAPANHAFRLVPTQNVDAMVDALTQTLNTHAAVLRQDARANSAAARQRFHADTHVARMETLFRELIQKGRKPRIYSGVSV